MPAKVPDAVLTAARLLRIFGYPTKEIASVMGRSLGSLRRMYTPERMEHSRQKFREAYHEEIRALGREPERRPKLTPEQHAEAHDLFAKGMKVPLISTLTGIPKKTLYRIVSSEHQASHRRAESERYKRWTPEYRHRHNLRQQARTEAARLGVPKETIYARWSCL